MGRKLGNIYILTNQKPTSCLLLRVGGRTDIDQRHFCLDIFSGLGIQRDVLKRCGLHTDVLPLVRCTHKNFLFGKIGIRLIPFPDVRPLAPQTSALEMTDRTTFLSYKHMDLCTHCA
jgi:hypothetical protein